MLLKVIQPLFYVLRQCLNHIVITVRMQCVLLHVSYSSEDSARFGVPQGLSWVLLVLVFLISEPSVARERYIS